MMLSDPALDGLLKRLHLANTRRAWRELARRAEQEAWTYHDFLTLLISEEIAHRQQTRLDRLVRRARFPFLKTIEDFNFTYQSIVRLALLGSALAPDFVTDGRCLILSGKPGRGKTHLAVAIAYRAIQNGFDARFVTAAELIDDLSAAFRSGRLADSLATYIHPGVLVIDEVGYLTYGTDAANMLFHVVNDRHRKKRAMIFTTNKPLTAWGRVLHDEDLAQAIVDRILERGRVLPLDGPSLRTKHLGLDDPTSSEALHQPARISGIEAPEFPEPTCVSLRCQVRDRLRRLCQVHLITAAASNHSLAGTALRSCPLDVPVGFLDVAKEPQHAHTEDTTMQTETMRLRELTVRYAVRKDRDGQPIVNPRRTPSGHHLPKVYA